MTESNWKYLTAASSAAGRAAELERMIQGGLITDMLEELAKVLTTSAIDHLQQASRSTDPRTRILHAADGLQTAYFAQVEASNRGLGRTLRMMTRPVKLRRSFKLAGECAAWVAVLLHHAGESPSNIREWVDRVAGQIAAEWRAEKARDKVAANPVLGELFGPRMNEPGNSPIYWSNIIEAYFRLESRVLPAELVRPRPWAWRTVKELQQHFGDDYTRLSKQGFFEREENYLPAHTVVSLPSGESRPVL